MKPCRCGTKDIRIQMHTNGKASSMTLKIEFFIVKVVMWLVPMTSVRWTKKVPIVGLNI